MLSLRGALLLLFLPGVASLSVRTGGPLSASALQPVASAAAPLVPAAAPVPMAAAFAPMQVANTIPGTGFAPQPAQLPQQVGMFVQPGRPDLSGAPGGFAGGYAAEMVNPGPGQPGQPLGYFGAPAIVPPAGMVPVPLATSAPARPAPMAQVEDRSNLAYAKTDSIVGQPLQEVPGTALVEDVTAGGTILPGGNVGPAPPQYDARALSGDTQVIYEDEAQAVGAGSGPGVFVEADDSSYDNVVSVKAPKNDYSDASLYDE